MKITKIVDRRTFSDYLIEVVHPEHGLVFKVVSVAGLSENGAKKHLEKRLSEEMKVQMFFDNPTTPWGWSKTYKNVFFTDHDVIAKRQAPFMF